MMEDSSRFGKQWKEWDARIDKGESPVEILRGSKDEDLVEVLGGESGVVDRRYARDVIATELLNRLRARSVKHPASAKAAQDSAKLAHDAAKEGQGRIHRAEGLLKRSGQHELGAAVSASAYKSLDASKAALDATKEHAVSLDASLSQSRGASELADEAAKVAGEGRKITRKLGEKMESMGRGQEGRDAADASTAIKKSADQLVTDSDTDDDEMRR